MSTPVLAFFVAGTPAPQGSKRHVGRGILVESSAKVKPWREAVKYAALDAWRTVNPGRFAMQFNGPVHVACTFYLQRPKGHYKRGGSLSAEVRDAAPSSPAVRPDLDKLLRSTLDALGEAGVFRDDAQVVSAHIHKVYAEHLQLVGAHITVEGAT